MTAYPTGETGSHVADVLALFREQGEISRNAVMEQTGLSRSTVNQRLATLVELGLIVPTSGGESTGGRPSSMFAVNLRGTVLLTADIGASGFVVAACDLRGTPLRHESAVIDVWEGPEKVLAQVLEAFERLRLGDAVAGIGIGVPGPVEFAAGRVRNPPIMTGWDDFDIAGFFAQPYGGVQVVIENDANARALAESRHHGSDNLISLKLGTGIGAGLVFNGATIRGAVGAAGDIGHTRAVADTVDDDPLPCRCGNSGCVEAYASGWALVRDLSVHDPSITHVADVTARVLRGDMRATQAVHRAGRVLGEAVADLVNILNPRTIVVSGQLGDCGEVLMSGLRERVYLRTHPLATRSLTIHTSDLGELAGVIGLALTTADQVFSRSRFDREAQEPQEAQDSPARSA
ncbi:MULTISPECIES: ROK family transcriptional regulator [unclassified Rathayibacter]|uniref:ROK family transcriptional regulator n=1 Tax=unclassified Rathayibacter TaxID=2609250 RepID=UPI000F913AE3|nr:MULTISPECIES: ROK family transcriptional regulator [unclassified Rathayibacter]ROP56848.1 glucokinase [Rathayibacter sp. PhB186]ROS28294.1 glucokinase [Rathayibacter sp. PhB127]ROS55233.1 glucokinase [Rathayibacter sp. PhB185]TCL85654.1 glucokinase [Rathayibacter sp. PhB192]TCM31475.1 glucokinase [Rathayibacter sp. PhB179]